MYLVGSLGSACMARAARRFSGCRNIAFFVDPARSDACVVYSVQFCEKCAIARNRSFWYSFKRVETSLHYVFIKFYLGKINIYIDMNSPLHEVICIILCEISTIPYFWKSSYEEAVWEAQNPYRLWSRFHWKSYHTNTQTPTLWWILIENGVEAGKDFGACQTACAYERFWK